jgi:hypothetical protein
LSTGYFEGCHLVEGAGVEDVEAVALIDQHLGEARGAHNQANHEWIVS